MSRADILRREWIVVDVAPSTPRLCVHCRKRPAVGESAYCGGSCRRMNNRLKWQRASGAVVDVLAEWTPHLPSRVKVDSVFEWLADSRHPERLERRAQLMTLLGLVWVSEAREWRKGE
jgi:hypothetical protein